MADDKSKDKDTTKDKKVDESKIKKGKATAMPVRKVKCGCFPTIDGSTKAAEFQNERYGEGVRVANPSNVGYRCVLCKKVFDTGSTF
jgi:hypothetical protein